jgi:peptidoglycan-associated lipoprotein
MRNIVLSTITALLLVACGSTPEAPAPTDEKTPGAVTPGGPGGPGTSPVPGGGISGDALGDWRKDPRLKDSKFRRSVYFDYDSDAIRAEFVPVVEAHAQFLKQYKGAKMLIQGNADERGSREYNIGLGQRRADAVRKRLVLLGATDAQIESVSLGEEKPACVDHGEDCWSKNRRGDLLYAGEY